MLIIQKDMMSMSQTRKPVLCSSQVCGFYLKRQCQKQDAQVQARRSKSVVVVEARPLEEQTYWGGADAAKTARQQGSCG